MFAVIIFILMNTGGKMNKVEKLFQYLGFSDTTMDSEQILKLLCLLTKDGEVRITKDTNVESLVNRLLDIFITHLETNNLNITELEIIEALK